MGCVTDEPTLSFRCRLDGSHGAGGEDPGETTDEQQHGQVGGHERDRHPLQGQSIGDLRRLAVGYLGCDIERRLEHQREDREECQGEGVIRVEMQFMADVELTCESCKGMRFKKDILEVKYHDKNIYDMLEMTIDDAIDFFNAHPGKTEKRIIEKLKPLSDVGLGYIKMGQSSSTLSGGESQRVKLAYFLSQERGSGHILFIFDEPTTGLHFHDINKLLKSINALVEHGHSVILIEHNQEVIKSSDWVIDLGPEGGEDGGSVVFEGKPEDLAKCKESYTGKYLAPKLLKHK